MEEIKEKNRVLGIISEYDELTGLLNLRGFMEHTKRVCHGVGMARGAYMIYGGSGSLKRD